MDHASVLTQDLNMQWIAEKVVSHVLTDEQDYNCISMNMNTHFHHTLKSRVHSVTSVPSLYYCGILLGHRDTSPLPSFERMVIKSIWTWKSFVGNG